MKQDRDKILIIIPFAGGSSYSMLRLTDGIIGTDFKILELPGRGKRINEILLSDIDQITNDLYNEVESLIGKYNFFYFYGHSMGGLLGYLLIHKIYREFKKLPECFFVSGYGGPSKLKSTIKVSELNSIDFWNTLKLYGGIPNEISEDEILKDFFEPIIKADFKAIENYKYEFNGTLNFRLIGFFGDNEKTNKEEMNLWQKETEIPISIIKFPGNHFFIYDNWNKIAKIIQSIIDEIV